MAQEVSIHYSCALNYSTQLHPLVDISTTPWLTDRHRQRQRPGKEAKRPKEYQIDGRWTLNVHSWVKSSARFLLLLLLVWRGVGGASQVGWHLLRLYFVNNDRGRRRLISKQMEWPKKDTKYQQEEGVGQKATSSGMSDWMSHKKHLKYTQIVSGSSRGKLLKLPPEQWLTEIFWTLNLVRHN